MILNTMELNSRLSITDQKREVERIRKASVGEVLFTASTCANSDVIDTLLHKSGVQYCVGVAGFTACYYKA